MFRRPSVLAVATFFAATGIASAQQGMLDLVPADAAAAVTIRNLNDLIKKGDKFVADADLQLGGLRPSQIFTEVYNFLGIQGGVDGDGSVAILMLPREKESKDFWTVLDYLAGVVPFTDLDKMAANFGFQKGQLKPGVITEGKAMNFGRFFYVRGKHVFLT